ncbi:MAG: hypothetical protein ACR2GD_04980, partial [Pyrinomonadaceae bacterium]
LHARVERDVVTICKALGYDLNTVEFAIKDGVPYAIDFMNPAPDAELASVGERNHNWIVSAMTDFVIEKLKGAAKLPEYRWTAMLNGGAAGEPEKKTTTAKRAAKTLKAATEKKTGAKKAANAE